MAELSQRMQLLEICIAHVYVCMYVHTIMYQSMSSSTSDDREDWRLGGNYKTWKLVPPLPVNNPSLNSLAHSRSEISTPRGKPASHKCNNLLLIPSLSIHLVVRLDIDRRRIY